MATTSFLLRGQDEFRVLYSSAGYKDGLVVTGYLIYSDLEKSAIIEFMELGDGIYAGTFPHEKQRNMTLATEKYGLVIKENGETKRFEIISLVIGNKRN